MIEDLNSMRTVDNLSMIKNQFEFLFGDVLIIALIIAIPAILINYFVIKEEDKVIQENVLKFKNGQDLISVNELCTFVINNKNWELSEDEKFVYRIFNEQEIRINFENVK